MEFKDFAHAIQTQAEKMSKQDHLFIANIDKDELYNEYLNSFTKEENPMFRERTSHDCSTCKNFIRNFGRVVAINDKQELVSVWDVTIEDEIYQRVANNLSQLVKSYDISDIFLTDQSSYGAASNLEIREGEDDPIRWYHFNISLPSSHVETNNLVRNKTRGETRDNKNVLKRSFDEIDRYSLDCVIELISQNSLYKGEEWLKQLKAFRKVHNIYQEISGSKKQGLYAWKTSLEVGTVMSRIRNHSIGTLLTNLSLGMDLEIAVKKYEDIVAPHNYQRSKPLITSKQVEAAEKQVKELGLEEALPARFATLDDITKNNVLFSNRDANKRMSGGVFDELKEEVRTDPKEFKRVKEISIDDFIKDVIPDIDSMEMYFDNDHVKNLVSLIAPKNKTDKHFLKWFNNFRWAYSGNMTDSNMKENVKALGGNVQGVLRFSIQWNDNNDNTSDLDARCKQPQEYDEIYYSNKGREHPSSGILDVDIITPKGVANENIIFTDLKKMPDGEYDFFVNCFNVGVINKTGFMAEVEFGGKIYKYNYGPALRQDEDIKVARVTKKGDKLTIKSHLKSSNSGVDAWGIKTEKFIPVSVMMYSPNYWDDQKGIGHKHYFFMLNGCINDSNPNAFFNEFLRSDLRDHRKVFEVMGMKLKIEDSSEQLSGLGFSSTKPASFLVRVTGKTKRVLKVNI